MKIQHNLRCPHPGTDEGEAGQLRPAFFMQKRKNALFFKKWGYGKSGFSIKKFIF